MNILTAACAPTADCFGLTVEQYVAAAVHIYAPAVMGGERALPDYTTKRPSDEEAIAYARSLFVDGAYDDGDGWRCGTILSVVASPSHESGEVVDVTLVFDMYGEVRISVWYEQNDAGKRVVYGEW